MSSIERVDNIPDADWGSGMTHIQLQRVIYSSKGPGFNSWRHEWRLAVDNYECDGLLYLAFPEESQARSAAPKLLGVMKWSVDAEASAAISRATGTTAGSEQA